MDIIAASDPAKAAIQRSGLVMFAIHRSINTLP